MPIGPNGEKRPPAVVANAVLSMRIVTGQSDEVIVKTSAPAKDSYQATKLPIRRPSRITMLAAVARWGPRPSKDIALGRA